MDIEKRQGILSLMEMGWNVWIQRRNWTVRTSATDDSWMRGKHFWERIRCFINPRLSIHPFSIAYLAPGRSGIRLKRIVQMLFPCSIWENVCDVCLRFGGKLQRLPNCHTLLLNSHYCFDNDHVSLVFRIWVSDLILCECSAVPQSVLHV